MYVVVYAYLFVYIDTYMHAYIKGVSNIIALTYSKNCDILVHCDRLKLKVCTYSLTVVISSVVIIRSS